ncbi:MAG: T9SS type A sorting domain-containing protein [Bacteroidota bacterium]
MILRYTTCLLFIFLCLGTFSVSAQDTGYQGCQEIDQLVEDECIALERLFENAGGLDWFNRTGWLRANQPCSWFGVTCNSKEWPLNVIKIELVDNNVSGGLPGELGNLHELQELIIENTSQRGGFEKLGNILPSTLATAKNLRVIRLGQNAIRGGIPNTYGRLQNLEVFDLHDNLLDGFLPDSLGRIASLTTINLSTNDLKGNIPPAWSALPNLESIDLSNNRLNGTIPEMLGDLQTLRSLRLNNNAFTGNIPRAIADLPELNWLFVSDNQLEGPLLPAIGQLKNQLSACSLENNSPNFCVPDREAYTTDASGLFCGVPVSSSCTICDTNTSIDGATCEGLESFYFDTRGYAWENNAGWLVHDSPCDWFGIGCENDNITELTLPNNNLDGNIPVELGQLSSLVALDLSQNELHGTLPFSVAALAPNMQTCSLSDNTVDLCVPENEQYRAIGLDPICQIPLTTSCTPLPAKISDVQAKIEGNLVIVSWVATSVNPASDFYVEKKAGNDFVQIGGTNGAAILQSPSPYELPLDAGPAGVHVYRVREDLPDGTANYSETIEIWTGVTAGFLVGAPYPNPAKSTAYLDLLVEAGDEVHVELYNALGQRIKTIFSGTLAPNTPHLLEVEKAQLAGGLYFIQVRGSAFSKVQTLVFRP